MPNMYSMGKSIHRPTHAVHMINAINIKVSGIRKDAFFIRFFILQFCRA